MHVKSKEAIKSRKHRRSRKSKGGDLTSLFSNLLLFK